MLLFLLLSFLIFFRAEFIPFSTDEMANFMVSDIIAKMDFSQTAINKLNAFNALSRPAWILTYIPLFVLLGHQYGLLIFAVQGLMALIHIAVLYFTFRLFERLFGKKTAILSTFLLAISYAFNFNLLYFASMNVDVGLLCLTAATYYLTKIEEPKSKWLAAFFVLYGILSRETIILSIAPIIIIAFLGSKSLRSKQLNYAIFLAPFVVFFAFTKIILGSFIGPWQQGAMDLNSIYGFFALNNYYLQYFFYFFIAFFLAFCFAVFAAAKVYSIIIAKKNASKKRAAKIISIPLARKILSLFEKHKYSLMLVFWLVGAVIPLAASPHESYRYLSPALPVILVFFSKVFVDSFLNKLQKKQALFFFSIVFLNLAFWVAFFNAKLFSLLLPMETVSLLFNFVFFAIVAIAVLVPVFFFLRSISLKQAVFSAVLAISLVLLSLTSIVQLNELNVFYVTHYEHSDAVFKAHLFLVDHTFEGQRIFANQGLTWFWLGSMEAFHIKAEFLQEMPTIDKLRKGDFVIDNQWDSYGIAEFINANKSRFRLLVEIGREQSRFPRSTLEKNNVLKTGQLFELFWDKGSKVFIYEFLG